MTERDREGLAKLKALMKEYGFCFGAEHDSGSDTHGMYGVRVAVFNVKDGWNPIAEGESGSWGLEANDIKD